MMMMMMMKDASTAVWDIVAVADDVLPVSDVWWIGDDSAPVFLWSKLPYSCAIHWVPNTSKAPRLVSVPHSEQY
jgi:hypothetical protein